MAVRETWQSFFQENKMSEVFRNDDGFYERGERKIEENREYEIAQDTYRIKGIDKLCNMYATLAVRETELEHKASFAEKSYRIANDKLNFMMDYIQKVNDGSIDADGIKLDDIQQMWLAHRREVA